MAAAIVRLVCGDEAFDVEAHAQGDRAQVTVAGQAFALRVAPVGAGVFVCETADRRETFHCVRAGDVVHLFWRGHAYRLEEETEGRRAAHRQAASGGLEAPMPGKVIAVKVEPGDTVVKGDELLVIEAMKMENAVRAPRDGRVRAVNARVGDMVSPGAVLVEME
jgi:3-methylcrotonyl-CoA carboxylase alpha subunit